MKIGTVAQVKAQFSAYVKSSADGPVVVTRNGKPVAVLVGVEDEDEIERLLIAYSPRVRSILDASRKAIAAGEGIEHSEFWAAVEGLLSLPQPEGLFVICGFRHSVFL